MSPRLLYTALLAALTAALAVAVHTRRLHRLLLTERAAHRLTDAFHQRQHTAPQLHRPEGGDR